MKIIYAFLAFFLLPLLPALAAEQAKPCTGEDRTCLFDLLESSTEAVTDQQWKDATWREMAKLLAAEGQTARALSLISRIKTPDTQAMTIRGIGMAVADRKLPKEENDAIFADLKKEAAKISDPPSHAIALTYVAMAQAFAKDDAGAMETAASMQNDALRHKAYAETAEIQAERGDLQAALASLAAIGDETFTNKAARTVSKIFADQGQYDSALATAQKIKNSYQAAQAVLYILTKQIAPEEVSIE